MRDDKKNTVKSEEEIFSQKEIIIQSIDKIREKVNLRYKQFSERVSTIKDAISRKKEARQKRIQKISTSNINTDNSMTDLIDDLRIN